jgi:hypothetical protein
MRLIILYICIVCAFSAHVTRYKDLVCENVDDYKLCNVSMGDDYILGDTPVYIKYESELYLKGDKQVAAHVKGKLVVPTVEWNITQWEFILNKYI